MSKKLLNSTERTTETKTVDDLDDLDDRWQKGSEGEPFEIAIHWYSDHDRTAYYEVWNLHVGNLDRPAFERLVCAVSEAVEPFLKVSSLAVKHFTIAEGQL